MSEAAPEKKVERLEVDLWAGRRKRTETRANGANAATGEAKSNPDNHPRMEAVVEQQNMLKALAAVERNQGAAGVDGVGTRELRPQLQRRWAEIKASLLAGTYQPLPVRRVEIPKPGGGTRMLGIPTVVDRLIQQAVHQVLSPTWEGDFSEHSYGFRPGRGARQAVKVAQKHVQSGKRWVVDMDLEKFFDRVNHDVLMARVARKVQDKRILKLIRRYLQSGVMAGGLVTARTEGTPQGGPLSPLLSNILLDDLDKELERRGHAFCRYADDCNIYVRSQRAGERVMASVSRFLGERLRLKVNASKSAVERPWKRKFLGYSLTWHRQARLKVATESVKRMRDKVRERFGVGRGRQLGKFIREELNPLLRGWANYFCLAEVKGVFEELDGWIRRKLRCAQWRQWKRPWTRQQRLRKLGFTETKAHASAWNGRGPWWNAGASHMNAAFPIGYYERLGLISLLAEVEWFSIKASL
jgi:RNA-directed DNA polymerase